MKPENILKHAVLALVIFATFMALWPVIKNEYRLFFREISAGFFKKQTDHLKLISCNVVSSNPKYDIETVFTVKEKWLPAGKKPPVGTLGTDSWFMGYFPLALLVSLTLATPVSAKRRARALLWGSLLVVLFVVIKMKLILYNIYGVESVSGELTYGFLKSTYKGIVSNLGANATIPVIIWILVTFKKEDFQKIFLIGDTPAKHTSDIHR